LYRVTIANTSQYQTLTVEEYVNDR